MKSKSEDDKKAPAESGTFNYIINRSNFSSVKIGLIPFFPFSLFLLEGRADVIAGRAAVGDVVGQHGPISAGERWN